jgi:glycosyltransferase involved in cell wall biosynthesis
LRVGVIRLSVVLPCYNEAESLPALLERYHAVWEDLPAELILVDNGSIDGTAQVLARELLRPEYAFARVVRVEKNDGYGRGILTGLRAARGEFLAFSHADMQCDAKDVFVAYGKLVEQADAQRVLVKGRRVGREFGPRLVTRGMSLLASIVLGRSLTDINAQPKVFHRSHLERLDDPPDGFQWDLYVLYRAKLSGARILTVPVEFRPRRHGQSKWAYSLASRWRSILDTVLYIFKLRADSGGEISRSGTRAGLLVLWKLTFSDALKNIFFRFKNTFLIIIFGLMRVSM